MQEEIEKIIEDTINKTILKLRDADLLKDYKPVYQKTEDILKHYPSFKLSDQPYAQKLCSKIEVALKAIKNDYYYEVITLYYFEGMTREEIAGYYNTAETTISRNKKRLIDKLSAILFSDDMIYEIFF